MRRNKILQERLRRFDVNRWAENFVQSMLTSEKTEAARRAYTLSGKVRTALLEQYRQATTRALMLDYDGTLVPFADIPNRAYPDQALLELITTLAQDSANEIVIISGRSRNDLEQWFGALPVSLIAEHGMWLRKRGEPWKLLRSTTADWKERVRPILQVYVDRLLGALLEEKDFSLAWHYRSAEPEQASLRAQELVDDLSGYTRNIDVQVLEGNRVIEVRNTGVNKGTAAMEWLGTTLPEFILGVGDDWTDEDLFRALPESAFSVRVGVARTAAKYHLTSQTSVRRLLKEFTEPKPIEQSSLPASDSLFADLIPAN